MNKTAYSDHKSELRENRQKEPIAIIGMGCRFPGKADSPEAFWNLLRDGVNAVTDIPSSRWDLERYYDPNPTPGKFYIRSAAFLETDEIEHFDAEFFRMASREAASLDPQQRLLLEVSWEALENAGIAPTSLAGSQTGVFVGIHWDDYSAERFYLVNPSDLNAYPTLSNLRSLSAGRIAYVLDLHGPTLQVDTACSSALVSVHLACQSLHDRECNLAIAGGVSLLLSPKLTIGFCQMNVLAKDGRCKTFSDSVDGFVQGEGCGMVILKRLSDAISDRDPILATIRSSVVNHDGYSLTLTTPASAAQEAMLRQAIENAHIEPKQVQYVETHGTGTPLGDPIEVKALAKVLGENRQEPLVIGSMKTNMGHLGAAAGVAGLIKTVLALQHNQIPPNLHFDQPNRRIPWHKLPVTVATELMPWLENKPKLAGVSCFGMSGTNAHVVVEAAPKPPQVKLATEEIEPRDHLLGERKNGWENELADATDTKTQQTRRRGEWKFYPNFAHPHLLTLSAKSEKALKAIAQRYLSFLDKTEDSLANICYTAAVGRSHFAHRLAIVANSKEDIQQQLDSFVNGEQVTGTIQGDTYEAAPQIAFLFTGQGSQYVDMGRELYKTQPIFRQVLQQCDAILRSYLDRPLLSILYPDQPEDIINLTAYTQPAIFALEYALAELWKSWGIMPDVVMGHSVGEYVAACVAGVFSLEDGLKLIATRGQLIQQLPQEAGKMVSILAGEDVIEPAIAKGAALPNAPYGTQVSIAAINEPQSIVISGDSLSIDAIVAELNAQEIKTRELKVSHAFHSPLMEPVLKPFAQVAAEVTYATPQIPLISNVTGAQVTDGVATADYWVRHIRQPVRFADSMNTLQQMGIKCFVEIGPKPILLGMGANCLVGKETNLTWLPSIRPDAELSTLTESLAQFYVSGININWQQFFPGEHRQKVVLPTYPFQKERCWVEVQQEHVARKSSKISAHPLLQEQLYSSLLKPGQVQFEAYLAKSDLAYLLEHRAFGQAIMPASAYFEMVLAAGNQLLGTPSITFEEVVIEKALKLEQTQTVQLVLNPNGKGYLWQIFGLALVNEEPTWTPYAAGKIDIVKKLPILELNTNLATLQTRLQEHKDIKAFYQQVATQELVYERSFQTVRRLWLSEGEALGQILLPKHLLNQPYYWHPAFLDGCLQVILAALPADSSETYLPIAYPHFTFWQYPNRDVFSYVKLHSQPGEETLKADLQLIGKDSQVYAQAVGLQLRKARSQALKLNFQNPEKSSSATLFEEQPTLLSQLKATLADERRTILIEHLCFAIRKIIGLNDSTRIEPQQSLFDLGLDSLMAVELRNYLEKTVACSLRSTLLFDYPTLEALVNYLLQEVLVLENISNQQTDEEQTRSTQAIGELSLEPVAIKQNIEIPNLWIKCPQTNPQAKLRLFCLPYAGGGSSIFRLWHRELPSNVELCPIELPGRENRIQEKPISNLEVLTDKLVEVFLPHTDKPFVLFGHSMGALIAYELARKLQQKDLNPVYLFVSGCQAPNIPELYAPLHLLPDAEFIEKFTSTYSSMPDAVLKEKELMQLFLPVLRADFALVETYIRSQMEPLDCPIFALGGLKDQEASYQRLVAWHKYTRSSFSVQTFPGGHFYLNENRSSLLEFISQVLKDYS
ncbi:MAG: alpha/beta fold hydrolase [Symploca sp. SIO2G7]|nr:alpha/beta fold hydrolase [Symploca sp. SIO2G7]